MQKLAGDAELGADLADFIFIERGQRLDNAAAVDQLLDAGDAVVMGLDNIGFAPCRPTRWCRDKSCLAPGSSSRPENGRC